MILCRLLRQMEQKYLGVIYFFLVSMSQNAQGYIKARCYFQNEGGFTIFKRAEQELKKLNFEIIQDSDPDIILTDSVTPEIMKTNIPIIIVTCQDAATLPRNYIKYLSKPQVKAFFTTYSLRPLALNNKPRYNDCYHFALVNHYAKLGKNEHIPPIKFNLLSKIRCVVCCHHHSLGWQYDKLKEEPIDFAQRRSIDVSFIGRVFFSSKTKRNNIYVWHRLAAINALKKVQDIKTSILLQLRDGALVFSRNVRLSFNDYMEIVKDSKIIISPWGLGEFCYRDFEAMLAGAIVIKPDSSFVQAVPDIYQNNITYVPCKPDFSDLPEVVKKVLDHYEDYYPMRKYARDLLINYDLKKFAEDFVAEVKAALS